MGKKVIEKVWDLYQRGWSYERIALELELKRDEVEKQCKKKQEEKDDIARQKKTRSEELEQDQEGEEDVAEKIEKSFSSPLKKPKRI